MSKFDLDLQLALGDEVCEHPDEESFQRWLGAATDEAALTLPAVPQLTIRITGEKEIAELNRRYRGKEGATNVLSFPFEAPEIEGMEFDLLGDIVISAPVVEREALEQNKSVEAHWAHMTLHGLLHLLGQDHQTDDQAVVMEALEVSLLRHLGYADPYSHAATPHLSKDTA